MHSLSGCDTTSYPYAKGKISALKTLLAGDFQGLAKVLGEVVRATPADLLNTGTDFCLALYGQPPGISLESARFSLFKNKKKSPTLMTLPPTSANLFQLVLRALIQVMLWKAADQL